MNDNGTLQLPPQASTQAADVDALYYFIFWGCMVFFVIIVALMAWFVIRYRRREGVPYLHSASHNTPLEIVWSVIPLFLVMIVFVWGFKGYMVAHASPGNALEYYVTGKQWLWQINHPTGAVEVNEMFVPVHQPAKVILQSSDVIHSFYVPDFRVKMDAYPNQYTTLWFEANRTGDFNLFCAEFCGREHSGMIGKVHVLSQADYDKWVEENETPLEGDPAEIGAKLYVKYTCVTCHTTDGSKLTGPSFKGIWGHEQPLADGSSVIVDENYVRESILDPTAKVVAGFQPVMPTFTGVVKPEHIDFLIAFIKSLQ